MAAIIDRIRGFNRHWTKVLGLLDQGLLDTEHTLAEARVLFELAQRPSWERLELRHLLAMDASFMTRVLSRLESKGLVTSTTSVTDRRALDVRLTDQGRTAFTELNERSQAQIRDLVAPLTPDQVALLCESMSVIGQLTSGDPAGRQVRVRDLRSGDLGWVVQRHGAIYADEFGWDADFEALVAQIVAEFHMRFRTGRERAWIAELDGARAGCVFCCRRDESTAQLRILLVEPWARGLGVGSRLVTDCVDFARQAGYASITLWTNSVLDSARRIYLAAGFALVDEDSHHSFGHDLVGQNWHLALTDDPA